jgi:AraC family transcriptional regulator
MHYQPINYANPEDNKKLFDWPPDVTSAPFAWESLFFEQRTQSEFETIEHSMQGHYLVVKLNSQSNAERLIDNKRYKERQRRGSTGYIPHGCPHSVVYPRHMGTLCLMTLPDQFVRDAAESLGVKHFSPVPKPTIEIDPLVLHAAEAIVSEIASGNPHGLAFADTMSALLAARLVSSISSPSRERPLAGGGLSAHDVRIVGDYIDGHLPKNVRLDELAKLTNLSRYHFCRAFKCSFGDSPHQYILRRKIALAENILLRSRQLTLTDVATEVGFCDASALSRAFKKIRSFTPGRLRRD